MPPNHRSILRAAILTFAVIGVFNFYHSITTLFSYPPARNLFSVFSSSYPEKDVLRDLGKTEVECRATFPGLMSEIDVAVDRGPFELERQRDDYTGLVQGRIEDGKLYVISMEKQPSRDMLFERNAVLQQLQRAIVTAPASEPLPNTTFTFTVLDYPRSNSWSFSRSNDPDHVRDGNYWVMPHFSFWSWPLPFIGPADQAFSRIQDIESRFEGRGKWGNKINQVAWRGTAWFNSVGNTDLRPKLLEATKGREWADVQNLEWVSNGEKATNSIGIEEFCGYRYIIYTEGITYSGRLPFHQSCASIIITPPINYLMHTTHLMRPLFASSVLRPSVKTEPNSRWPQSYPPSEANIVFVDPDWKDLEATVMWLRDHPKVAEGIARRQREMVKKGYVSEAAEVCYWRSLVRGWASVVRLGDEKWEREGGEGIRFETFSLLGKVKWD